MNSGSRRGRTPLINSVVMSDELFELLLVRYKADPNKLYDGGLMHSALSAVLYDDWIGEKRYERAEMLLKHGADINLDLDRGTNALLQLFRSGRFEESLWLLERGADYEARDAGDRSMIYWLRSKYKLGPSPEARNGLDKIRDWLVAHGVDRSRLEPE